jgi:hypothetical protein
MAALNLFYSVTIDGVEWVVPFHDVDGFKLNHGWNKEACVFYDSVLNPIAEDLGSPVTLRDLRAYADAKVKAAKAAKAPKSKGNEE